MTTPVYSFHQLSPTDLAAFKSLLRVFGEAFEDRETYEGAVPSDAYLRALLNSPTFVAVAARDGDMVVGGLAAYELRKFERERSEIYIYDLAVLAAHRRRGIATGLIVELKRIAKARGAYVIYVQADKGESDLPAIRLYQSLGLQEDVFHFDIPVD